MLFLTIMKDEGSKVLTLVNVVTITGDLFKFVHLRTPLPAGTDTWWPLKHIRLAERAIRILFQCFLVVNAIDARKACSILAPDLRYEGVHLRRY